METPVGHSGWKVMPTLYRDTLLAAETEVQTEVATVVANRILEKYPESRIIFAGRYDPTTHIIEFVSNYADGVNMFSMYIVCTPKGEVAAAYTNGEIFPVPRPIGYGINSRGLLQSTGKQDAQEFTKVGEIVDNRHINSICQLVDLAIETIITEMSP